MQWASRGIGAACIIGVKRPWMVAAGPEAINLWICLWAQSLPGYRTRYVCTSQDGRLPMGGQTYRQCLEAPLSGPSYIRLNNKLNITLLPQIQGSSQCNLAYTGKHSNIPQLHPVHPHDPFPVFAGRQAGPHKPSYFPESLTVAEWSWIQGMWTASYLSMYMTPWRVSEKWSEMCTQVFTFKWSRLFDRNKFTDKTWHPFSLSTSIRSFRCRSTLADIL